MEEFYRKKSEIKSDGKAEFCVELHASACFLPTVELVGGATKHHGAPRLLSPSQCFQIDDQEEKRGLEPSLLGMRSGDRECERGWHPGGRESAPPETQEARDGGGLSVWSCF